MLPSSGYFKNLPCPYFKSGFCTRPHCHYKHATPSTTSKITYIPTPVNRIPEYKPTPIAQLKKLKSNGEDEVKKIKKEAVDDGFDLVSDIIKDSLKKEKEKIKEIKKGNKKSKAVSYSNSSSKSSKTKTQIIAEKEEELRRKKTVSESKSDSPTKTKSTIEIKSSSLPSSASTSPTKETSKASLFIADKDKVSNKSSVKNNCSSPETDSTTKPEIKQSTYLDDIKNDLTKLLETPPEDDDLVQISVAKKPRVAHAGPSELSLKISSKKPGKMTPSQIMFNRFNNAGDKEATCELNSLDSAGKKRVAHNLQVKTSQSSSLNQKTAQKAIPTKRRPVIPTEFGGKIPMVLRTRYLNLFIDELLKFCSEDDAYSRGLSEEKTVYTRSTSKNVYLNLAVNTVKRIRTEASSKLNGQNGSKSDNDKDKLCEPTIGNRKVSHEMILNGPHAEGCSIEKRRATLSVQNLSDSQLFSALKRYLMTAEQLKEYGYPLRDPEDSTKAILPPSDIKKKNDFTSRRRICYRCMKTFQVDENGYPVDLESCIYHSGRLWNERFNRSIEKKYSCCGGDPTTGGCCSGKTHVVDGAFHPSYTSGYVTTTSKDLGLNAFYGIYSLDCEMCYTTIGLELTRISVIDHKLNCVYETLVKPDNPVLDYNTKFSGIKEGDLDEIDITLKDVQAKLMSLVNSKTILIGHSLESDLKALKIIHETVIDTAAVFPHRRGLPYKRALRTLMAEFMHAIIQNEVDGHDSQEDAVSCMKLILWKVQQDITKIKR